MCKKGIYVFENYKYLKNNVEILGEIVDFMWDKNFHIKYFKKFL